MKDKLTKFKTAKIVYYSGTGGTERAARYFEAEFKAMGTEVSMQRLSSNSVTKATEHDILVTLYPVYACSAPEPVYNWIEKTKAARGTSAVVISVSGGGEVVPNTACRKTCIKHLEAKGYKVIYEKMLVMPSNWIVSTKEPLALMLLEVLPQRIAGIVKDITKGKINRTKSVFIDNFFSYIGRLEKIGARYFGHKIIANGDCTGCGWCSKNCNAGNITMLENKPHFGKSCQLCLNCIYGCPHKALVPKIGKFVVVKEGYNLNELEKKLPFTEQVDVEKLTKGYLWSGIRKYLLDFE